MVSSLRRHRGRTPSFVFHFPPPPRAEVYPDMRVTGLLFHCAR